MDANGTSDRVKSALARIDAAAARIAAAAAALPRGGPGSDPELEARYEQLQREATQALQQIDHLIGALER